MIRNKIVSPDLKARATPSWIGGKTTTWKLKSTTNPSVAQFISSSNPPEGSASFDSFYSKFHRLQRILEEDSSSDNSSLISNNSDEGSSSTDSTRDSSSTDDFSDYIFGDPGRGWNSPWRNSSDSDTSSSSSSSPLYSKHSSLSDLDAPETSGLRTVRADAARGEDDGLWDGLEREGTVPFLHSDTTRQCRKLESSSRPKTDFEKVGSDSLNNVKYDVSFRRSTWDRTSNI